MAWGVKVMFIRAGIFWVAGGVGRSGEVAGDGGLGWDCSSGGVVGCGGFQSGRVLEVICTLLVTWGEWVSAEVLLFLV